MQTESFRVLALSPEQDSTKVGLFRDEILIFQKNIQHDREKLEGYPAIGMQHIYRSEAILEELDKEGINMSRFHAVCGTGGLLRPLKGGTYPVNAAMIRDLLEGYGGHHVSNLGGLIAFDIAEGLNIPAYITDPVVVDELLPVARFSGMPFIERKSVFHALNQKRAGRSIAKELGKEYKELRLIVVHIGKGISVGAHLYGRVVDVNNGFDGEGPFSTTRAGGIPPGGLLEMCMSGKAGPDAVLQQLIEGSGLIGYLGTDEWTVIESWIQSGDNHAELVYEAMVYQIAKEIGAASTVLQGNVDAIVLTGDLAYSERLRSVLSERISWIADVYVRPGEDVLKALAEGTLRVLRKEEEPVYYEPETIERMREVTKQWQKNMML